VSATVTAKPLDAAPALLCVQARDIAEVERLLQVMQTPSRRCASGSEMIAPAQAGPLSCVIAAVHLTDMSASALIDALNKVAPGLAVIVVADNLAVSDAVTVMHSGAHAVIDSRTLSTGLLHHLKPLLHGR
jgi:FixJ family two-component response regulator